MAVASISAVSLRCLVYSFHLRFHSTGFSVFTINALSAEFQTFKSLCVLVGCHKPFFALIPSVFVLNRLFARHYLELLWHFC